MSAFGALRRERRLDLDQLDEQERDQVIEMRDAIKSSGFARYSKDNHENGTALLQPYITEWATQDYMLFIRDYLSGNIDSANTRFRKTNFNIMLCAHVMSALRPAYERGEALYRGLNLSEPPPPDGLMPYIATHKIYSFTDDKTVACGFAAMGPDGQYIVRAKPNPKRVIFHYSYLVLYPDMFTQNFSMYDEMIGAPTLVKGFTESDIYHLLPQREVLLVNGSGLKQRVVTAEEAQCARRPKYVMMGEDTAKRYERAMTAIDNLGFSVNDPYVGSEKYKQRLAKLRDEDLKDYFEYAE